MTTSLLLPPGLVLIVGALLLPFLRGGLRTIALLALPLLTLWLVWTMPEGVALTAQFLGYDLTLVKVDKLSRLFALVFAIMAFAGGLYSLNQPRTLELSTAREPGDSSVPAELVNYEARSAAGKKQRARPPASPTA